MNNYLARDIRHAIAEAMAAHGLEWSGLHDSVTGEALASLPAQPVPEPAIAEETRRERDALVECWKRQPRYYDDCDPGQNDPYYAWYAEMDRLVNPPARP